MQNITINRFRLTADKKGTIGVIFLPKNQFVYTLEPPWLDNKCNDSCIPAGSYICKKIISKKYGKCIAVLDVPNRSFILLHRGNYTYDTKGCILIAKHALDNSLYKSIEGYELFYEYAEKTFLLTITDLINEYT